jgi:Peptidase M16 inactive domain
MCPLQELVCSRLYVAVRDRLNLTYDVSFTIEQHDRLNACWWYVNVTASPDLVAQATQACIQARSSPTLCNG